MKMKAVILAGGSGTRLWPMSRQQLPKQFLKFDGDESMLAATISRLSPMIEKSDVWVVTNEKHATGEAFSELNRLHKILEPCGRNTAPAIALAAALLQEDGSDPVMLVLPADHVIKDVSMFHQYLKTAINAAEEGKLITFGIIPDHPNTGFGYIQVESAKNNLEVMPVKRFTEKPDLDTAKSFLETGNYFWNSGIFVWKASFILQEIQKYSPDIYNTLMELKQNWQSEGADWQQIVHDQFHKMPSISIDYAVLEPSDNVVVLPVSMGWSDVGSWDAVHDISEADKDGNVISGNSLVIDCKDTLIRSQSRLIAAVGIDNIIAVETPDAILLCPKGGSQRVREIISVLKTQDTLAHIEHTTVRRPWGSYTVLENGDSYKMKRIEVHPGESLSLQSHQHRSEHWVVVSGTATVTCGTETNIVSKNESTYIPIGTLHRLENKGKIPLQLIEVQVGDYLEEDDIERFEDIYDRN